MIEYINLLLLLTMFGATCYAYYRLKKIFYLISIVMDSEILDQLTNLGRDVDSEFLKPKRGRKKKADTKINEFEDKRELLVFYLVTQKCTQEKNIPNSKLMRWIVRMSVHF